jgi:parvulin-like peptidyl-prolyl isomerase
MSALFFNQPRGIAMTNDQYAGRGKLRKACTQYFWLLGAVSMMACAGQAGAATAAGTVMPAATQSAPFAKVGEIVISHQDFDSAFAQAARSKFYHGKAPDNAVALLQREVGQSLVDDILLAKEAVRRKLQIDQAAVKQTLAGYEERYRGSEQWKNSRERVLPGLKAKLERDSLLEQLGKQVRTVAAPTPGQLEQYWATHKDKFTSPEQVHVSMILLKVDPSSPAAKWDAANAEGAAIVKRLKAGAGFKELARLHSGDGSAEAGGDMGYVHRGMLPDLAQEAVDKLKPGEISPPVVLLEGVAVILLQERKAANLNSLDAVRDRARDLWMRERGDEAWAALLAKLRRETPVKIDESRMVPLAAAATTSGNAAR